MRTAADTPLPTPTTNWPARLKELAFETSDRAGPLFVLLLVVAVFGIAEPQRFLTALNLGNVAGQTAVLAVAAVGMTFIIISGGIDLSVGSVVALAGVYAAMVLAEGYGLVLGLTAGLATGAVCGLVNGLIITRGHLPPFIVTLGMMEIVRGLALESANGMPVTNLPRAFSRIGNAVLEIPLGASAIYIPYSLFILLPVALGAAFVLRYTVFGTHVYAVGSNEQTARLCGVNVGRVKTLVYVISGLLTGLAGIMYASRLNTGQPSEGVGMELEVIAAVVVGGGSLMGGKGSILGSVVGAFIIKFLRNGCVVAGVSPFIQRIIIGLIIIAAVWADHHRRQFLMKRIKSRQPAAQKPI
ncbi:MAG: ABC transporter permease [Phycisphaerae bacterium]|nr:ABC transporter permease [Phycisphaerae bacterium]